MSEPLSVRLRAATADLHRCVEDGVDILRRTESREGAVDLLRRMEAFYRALEPRIADTLSSIEPEYLLPRSPRLRADLDGLSPGWTPLDPPELGEAVKGLGALYVVEGAALGGQVIARHLENRLGFTSTFFKSEGVGPRWRAFRALLDANDDDRAIEAATATFLAFEAFVVAPHPNLSPSDEREVSPEAVLV